MENGTHAPEMPAPEASQQILDAFSNLAPLFRDNTLMQEPNPRETKTRRRDPPQKPDDQPKNRGTGSRETPEHNKLLLALAHLAIKQDQELQSMRKQDQFILFLSSEATGAFHLMLQETANWKKLMDSPNPGQQPLRQHLILCLVKSLRQRAEQIVNAQDTDQLFQLSLQKGLILQDRSFPYHRWDPNTHKLILDKKTPVSAKLMGQQLEEILELLLDPQLVVRFHALKAPQQNLTSIPWRLQLNVRHDRAYEIFQHLSFNAVWMVVGASMKPHSLGQSSQATQIQNLLTGNQKQGKGKGKASQRPRQQ